MSLDLGLRNIHVLVTGASGGIGFSLTKTFLSLGSLVTAQYNTDPRSLSTIDNPNLTILQADLTSESSVISLFDRAQQRPVSNHDSVDNNSGNSEQEQARSPVQILIVNHGIFPPTSTSLMSMTLSQWRTTHSVNLDSSFLVAREFLRRLQSQPPQILDPVSITLIGSTAGKFGEADHGDYASTKAAMMYGLLPTLKNEIVRVAPRGRVNCVCPGWVRTPMAEQVISNDRVRERALASTPLQKVAEVEDVSGQVAVLSSPVVSGHVSGVNVMVDGGMEGRLLFPPTMG